MNPPDSLITTFIAECQSLIVGGGGGGVASFSLSLGDGPLYDLLLWGVNDPLPKEQIELLGGSLQIVPEPSAILLGAIGALILFGFHRAKSLALKVSD